MPGNRIDALRQASHDRHERTLKRAEATLRALAKSGGPVTVRGVAEAAAVSRSWLYRQPQLIETINELRQSQPTRGTSVPAGQRATVDSLHQQIHTYREEIARLRAQNDELNNQLARYIGQARARNIPAPDEHVKDMSTT